MKSDAEVRLYMKERSKGRTQAQAAARAGMSLGTARKYERAAQVPSQLKQPRTYRTHPNPFADDWPWAVAQLERDPALQAKTLFGLLCERRPDQYRPVQLRTFQRHVAAWRLAHGPDKEVVFPQVHRPGVAAQSDFTHMGAAAITLGGAPFPHLLFHLVFVYSNVEAVRVCFAESFEALVEGLEGALWALGGVPRQHRTDHLGAAIRPRDAEGQAQARERYAAVMRHYREPWSGSMGHVRPRASQSRTVSWVKTTPRGRNSSARSRRLNLYRRRQRTTSRTRSVGYCKWLKGVPLRSLKVRRHARQWKVR